jgi:hypothetical protein
MTAAASTATAHPTRFHVSLIGVSDIPAIVPPTAPPGGTATTV